MENEEKGNDVSTDESCAIAEDKTISLDNLVAAGSQFGHKKMFLHPKMQKYIYMINNGICILDLDQTMILLEKACEFIKSIASKGGKIIWVGTRPNIKDIVSEEAMRSGGLYVNSRWLPGTFTNFKVLQATLKKKKKMEENMDYFTKTKKEKVMLQRRLDKMSIHFSGLKTIKALPQLMVVVGLNDGAKIAAIEAKKMSIPVIGITDTNCNPDLVDYAIPANDDSVKSVSLILHALSNSVIEGLQSSVNKNTSQNAEKTRGMNE